MCWIKKIPIENFGMKFHMIWSEKLQLFYLISWNWKLLVWALNDNTLKSLTWTFTFLCVLVISNKTSKCVEIFITKIWETPRLIFSGLATYFSFFFFSHYVSWCVYKYKSNHQNVNKISQTIEIIGCLLYLCCGIDLDFLLIVMLLAL